MVVSVLGRRIKCTRMQKHLVWSTKSSCHTVGESVIDIASSLNDGHLVLSVYAVLINS